MKLKKLIAGPLLVLALAFPHAVNAEDFTFGVKVELRDLHPDVTNIKVKCKAQEGTTRIGDGFTDEKVPANGKINKTVQVKFNALPGKNPADADLVRCEMQFNLGGTASTPLAASNSACIQAVNEFRCAITGEPFAVQIFSPIP